jgi:hypothetical protein
MSEPLPPRPTAPATPPPAEVSQAATRRGLGDYLMVQQSSNPFGNFARGIGIAMVLFVGGFMGLGWLAVHLNVRKLAYVAFICAAVALVAAIMAIRALLVGFSAMYVFANGLVRTKNRKVNVVMWADIDELLLWKAGGKTSMRGKLLGYYIGTFDGRKVPLEAQSAKGDRTVGERLQQIVHNLGRPVRDSGPYTGRLRA